MSDDKESVKPESNVVEHPKAEAIKQQQLDARSLEDYIPIDEYEEEEIAADGQKVTRKGIYLLPNLVTAGALFAGFYAIVQAINGDFAAAGLAIFFGQLLDGFDGRVARMTNTQSKFGQEFDSLSDMVAFGIAPAVIVFTWCLSSLDKIGWAVAFIYVVGAAVRLARFNAQADESDNRFFTGLASPAAATLIASSVWFTSDIGYTPENLTGILVIGFAIMTTLVSFLMVSNVRYSSFKGLDFSGPAPVFLFLGLILIAALIAMDPPRVLCILAGLYALSGPVLSVFRS